MNSRLLATNSKVAVRQDIDREDISSVHPVWTIKSVAKFMPYLHLFVFELGAELLARKFAGCFHEQRMSQN